MDGRFYARDATHATEEEGSGSANDQIEIVRDCVHNIRRFGFCVVNHIIPPPAAAEVHDECTAVTPLIREAQKLAAPGEMPNQVLFLPKFQQYLSHPLVVCIARALLDTHVRIAQTHIRHVPPDGTGNAGASNSTPMPCGRLQRGWHTDWPHDLSTCAATCCTSHPRPPLAGYINQHIS